MTKYHASRVSNRPSPRGVMVDEEDVFMGWDGHGSAVVAGRAVAFSDMCRSAELNGGYRSIEDRRKSHMGRLKSAPQMHHAIRSVPAEAAESMHQEDAVHV
jgi:hypothetical protein